LVNMPMEEKDALMTPTPLLLKYGSSGSSVRSFRQLWQYDSTTSTSLAGALPGYTNRVRLSASPGNARIAPTASAYCTASTPLAQPGSG